ncbi:MAG TPA: hypothetical protein VFW03_02440 [Gemmatimonadaceae bacterium]|nr:hypothetical protein [Gemmatimonadaceae bacterium]
MPVPIDLLPVFRAGNLDDLLARYPTGEILACDFYIAGAELGSPAPGGYRLGERVVNIDHHAPTARMAREISSTNLALDWRAATANASVESRQAAGQAVVVINHTDCDSILSSGIASCRLDALPAYGRAALAADHTGEENAIADALQALEPWRDVELSFATLRAVESGAPLPAQAREALARWQHKRDCAAHYVAQGRVVSDGLLAFGILDGEIDGICFPPLLPDAVLILLAVPKPNEPGRWVMKLRLGARAAEGFTIHDLHMTEFDRAYGGRWNAGSNARAGGTTIPPAVYAEEVRRRLARAIGVAGTH